MAIMTKFLLISWCFFLVICESLNADNTPQLSPKRQVEAARSEVRNEVINWTCPMEHSAGDVSELEKWKVFLNSLYCKFSEYEIQKFKGNYNVADLENWGKPDAIPKNEPGIEIRKDNFQEFLDKIKEFHIANLDSIKKFEIEEPQLEDLNDVLNLTLKQAISINCIEAYMYIKGDYIIMSHVNKSFETGAVEESCLALLRTDRPKILNIFALNTVFVDDDIPTVMDAFKNLTIISPKWEIIGKRMIDIRGKSGEPLSRRIASAPLNHGADGRPGAPGWPGGNFIGIGEQFLNGENLQIFVSGGNGGPGEDGANGKNGEDTPIGPKPERHIPCETGMCKNDKKLFGLKCREDRCYRESSSTSRCDFTLLGENGAKGGDAGNGGKGGIGGHSGVIDLIELNSSSKIFQFHSSGENGTDGRGGTGGNGGKNGDDIAMFCRSMWDGYGYKIGYNRIRKIPKGRASPGENGLEGANSKDILAPKEANAMRKIDKAEIINEYKSYLRENLNDRFKYPFLMKFLEQLESSNKVKSFYDTLGLADELRSLEEHFNMLNDNIDFRPFYQSLLNRTSEYAQNFTSGVHKIPYKRVLGYLYTTTLGRLHNLEDGIESNLIVNVSYYLETVKTDIEKLKVLKDAKTKKELINAYKEDYKKQIDAKIKEAKKIISDDILTEIDDIANKTNLHIESLLDEVIKSQKKAKANVDELKKRKQELARSLQLQSIMSGLKIFGSVLENLGAVGELASSVIGIGSTVTENIIFNNQGKQAAPTNKVIADLESLKREIQKIEGKKVNELKKVFEDISREAKEFPALSDIREKALNFTKRLDEISKEKMNSEHLKEFENMVNELKAMLKAREKARDENRGEKVDAVVEKMKKALEFSSTVLDAYVKHNSNQAKLGEIDKAIRENQDTFVALKEFEDQIYITIIPMLQTIQKAIEGILSNIHAKSKVVLDVAKWKVKSTLKKIMTQMQALTANFKVHGELLQSMEMMKEAIVTLIDVQEHIQDYQKDQTFANFFADVNSATVSNAQFVNTELEGDAERILNYLEITLTSSIIVQRYKVAFGALKQFVFPFAENYLNDLVLPKHLKLDPGKGETSLKNLTYRIETEIDKIISKLGEYDKTVNKGDFCKGSGRFTSNLESAKPFFVWESSKYKEMISKLLSGEKVTMNADITESESAFDKYAIKFNNINFQFKSNGTRNQSEIDDALKKFWIVAIHLGNSYYRYSDKIYLMETAVRKFWYHFETDENGLPAHTSESYDKIKEGDIMLSPYATWELMLINATHTSFNIFNKFEDKIHLELSGYGNYVIKLDDCLEHNVDKYYKPIDKYIMKKKISNDDGNP